MEISHTRAPTRWSFLSHIDKFWNGVDATFLKVTKNTSCGAHVHVAAKGRRYTFEELKAIAFAVAAQEDFIIGILPPERIDNRFARPSSVHSDDLREDLERGLQLGPQETLKELGRTISRMRSPQELYVYMQGHDRERQRYALWNFKNTVGASACGTVEFRGGRHLRGKVRTKRWIAFAVAFVSMAITNKDQLHYMSPEPGIDLWWKDLRDEAGKFDLTEFLPPKYWDMRDVGAVGPSGGFSDYFDRP